MHLSIYQSMYVSIYLSVYLSICVYLVRTMLLALIGFMPTSGLGTIGSLECSPEERRRLAKRYYITRT